MKRNRRRADSRDAGGFVALPWAVLDSAAYRGLSYPARALLMEFARQYVQDNNGRLLASMAHLSGRGWNSYDVILRAKRELMEAGFVHETVKGARPNRASWYAVTWQALDRLDGYDVGAVDSFRRSAYRDGEVLPVKPTREELFRKWDSKNAALTPAPGVERHPIAPPPGVETLRTAPPPGAIEAQIRHPSTPSPGDHLEKPSIGAVQSASVPGKEPRAAANSDEVATPHRFREGSACARLFDALVSGPKGVAELEALGIANPTQRVAELRGRGYRIDRQTPDGQVPRYALLSITATAANPAKEVMA